MNLKQILAALALIAALARSGVIYPQTLVVRAVEETTEPGVCALSLYSSEGVVYNKEVDSGEYQIGDMVAAIMYDEGTPDDISDDTVVAMRRSGFSKPVDGISKLVRY